MSNNFDITVYDFEKICRTCLVREDLKPLYGNEKYSSSTCLVDMLMSCTVVKFAEDDGLPVKICANCILEIKQAFSFAKRCETTDTILRKCVKIKTELVDNSSQSQTVEAGEEMQLDINPEITLPNMRRTMEDFKFMDVKEEHEEYVEKQEEDVKIENEKYVEKVKEEEELIIANDDPADETHEEDANEDQDKTYSEKCDNQGSSTRRRSTNSQIVEESSKDKNGSPSAKRIHTKKEKGVRPYGCDKCKKAFSHLESLKTHKLIHTGKKPYVCSMCSKAFTHPRSLKNHIRTHTEEKPYSCEECGNSYSTNIALIYHERSHTSEKPNVGSVCNKSYTTSTNLKTHMRIHTGEKPYSYGVSGKGCSTNLALTYHNLSHTNEKPNVCSICSKTFTYRTSLLRHMSLTHTGEKSFTCDICSKTFSQPSNLKNHKRIHTGETALQMWSLQQDF